MKKTFSKVISAILVLALALGAMSFNVFAAEETTVEIISNNVKIDDHVRLMYAVDATNLEEGDEIVVELTNGGETLRAVRTEDETVKGKECAIFVSAKGVAPFDIAEEFTAVAKVVRDGEVVATSAPTTYSVLEYIYEWLLVADKDDPDYAATLKALYAYAVASEKCFFGTEEITNLAYVRVAENGAFDGKVAGMVKVGDDIVATTDLVAESGKKVVWNATYYNMFDVSDTEESMDPTDGTDFAFKANSSVILTPDVVDANAVKDLDTIEFGAKKNPTTHNDGSSISNGKSYSGDKGYSITLNSISNVYGGGNDAQGNSILKLGTSSKTGSFTFTVDENVTSVIIRVSGYKKASNGGKYSVNGGTVQTLSVYSNDGAYYDVVIDTTTNKTITFASAAGGVRIVIDSITLIGRP